MDAGGRATHDCMDAGGRLCQEQKVEEQLPSGLDVLSQAASPSDFKT